MASDGVMASDGAMALESQSTISLAGQVTWRRRFHATFALFDLCQRGGAEDGEVARLLVSSGIAELSLEDTKSIIKDMLPGSVVRVAGRYAPQPGKDELRFEVTALLEVVSTFGDEHPGQAFMPQPRQRTAPSDQSENSSVGQRGAITSSVCKRFVNGGGRCNVADCPFAHDMSRRTEWAAERRTQRRATSQQESVASGDPHGADAKRSSRERASVFAEWLVATYGADELGKAGGVLDIAGGRGDISFELHTLRGIRCTLVDPRAQRPRKHVIQYLRRHPGANVSPHVQAWVGESPSGIQRTAGEWPRARRGGASLDTPALVEDGVEPDASASSQAALAAAVAECSLLVGMHPDEATEWIVDTALRHGKPFAIVPCCVFGDRFLSAAERQSGSGGFEGFCQRLMAKDDRIVRSWLGFEGKNTVLFLPGGGAQWRPDHGACVVCT